MMATQELSQDVGVRQACAALGVSRATFYRQRRGQAKPQPQRRPARSPRALSRAEGDAVRSLLHNQRFCDRAPREVYATELDAGRYHCSVRTMYRILQHDQSSRERRNQLRHPHYRKPELLATGPNQVWSWDISVPQQAAWEMGDIWPPAISLQEQVANRRKRLWSKVMVVSVTEKASLRRQVWIKKTNASEPPLNCRKL
jgi:hypothetical protein